MNRRIAGRYAPRSRMLTVYDSRGETLARFKMHEPASSPGFRKLRLYEQSTRAARIAKGCAIFIVMLAFAALLSVDDYDSPRQHETAERQ